jgi:hypothetical protein
VVSTVVVVVVLGSKIVVIVVVVAMVLGSKIIIETDVATILSKWMQPWYWVSRLSSKQMQS